jgi:hypothetical protein
LAKATVLETGLVKALATAMALAKEWAMVLVKALETGLVKALATAMATGKGLVTVLETGSAKASVTAMARVMESVSDFRSELGLACRSA